MSTAFYPTNMRRQSTGGYSNNSSLNNIPYMSWKGTGIHRNPIGMTSTHIRPLTNLDPGNVFQTGFGLPRPIKHYRKGTVLTIDPDSSSGYSHQSLIEYNMNRSVKSSIGTSLGGGNGGTGLISQMIDMPGSFSVKYNEEDTDDMCKTYNGIKVVSGLTPINSLTENPQPNVEKQEVCYNHHKKALRRVLPANTVIKHHYFEDTTKQDSETNYYQSNYAYLQNRRKNCCSKGVYKPNNQQFATQGGVSSSARILKLNVDTITKAACRRDLRSSTMENPNMSYIYKDKVPNCKANTYGKKCIFGTI